MIEVSINLYEQIVMPKLKIHRVYRVFVCFYYIYSEIKTMAVIAAHSADLNTFLDKTFLSV